MKKDRQYWQNLSWEKAIAFLQEHDMDYGPPSSVWLAAESLYVALQEAIAEEREDCAKIAEEYMSATTSYYAQREPYTIGCEIADAIREQGEENDG